MDTGYRFWISPLDKMRFGIDTGKVYLSEKAHVQQALLEAKEKQIELLVARCKVNDLGVVQEMERNGFFITDTLVYYTHTFRNFQPHALTGDYTIRLFKPDEPVEVREIAKRTFAGYFGHYHADDRLDKQKCDEVYADWSYRSCAEKTDRDDVFVVDENGKMIGFATMRLNSDVEGEGVLFGVVPEAQGKGIYRQLILNAMNWCYERKCERIIVSTQINNIAVQKVWTRAGFEIAYAYYTFHKWMD